MRKHILSLTLALGTVLALAGDNKFPEISTDALKKAIGEKRVALLDVNGSDSWQKAHIPGALNYETVKNNLAAKLPANKDALVVAYCGNEHCPAYRAGAQAAANLGYTNVKHYTKGIQGWIAEGQATEKGNDAVAGDIAPCCAGGAKESCCAK